MKLYNTKTLNIEEFKPLKEGEVSMYVCGPTVYNDVHVGNVRPVVVFDTLRRLFEHLGYRVKYVSNYTDVDDKIINEAKRLAITEKELTDSMIAAYMHIREQLHAQDLYKTPRVSETMPEIISFISDLEKNDYAYEVDGDVYFKTDKVNDYGSLSKQKLDDLQVGARIESNDAKENALDFALWKKTSEGLRWDAPWSTGRPGWHSECVVMIKKHLGELIDIHGGGKDLRFPHHENERAQAKALYNSDLSNYWLHSGMIDIDGVKMSKSLGNFIKAKDILNQIDGNTLRWFLLGTHYRSDLNVSDTIIESSKKELEKVSNALKQAHLQLSMHNLSLNMEAGSQYQAFIMQMEDDLNTPNAYGVIFETVKLLNNNLRQQNYEQCIQYYSDLHKMLDVLGIVFELKEYGAEDRELYQKWLAAKSKKDFETADKYRNELLERGVL